jgi:sporadic carbohydrate cluster protein (TIGR04323 family)
MAPSKGFRGYISSRPVRGTSFPQRVQNAIVRTYASRRMLPFKLSLTEYAMPGCFMILESLLDELPDLAGVVLFSMFMLPHSHKKRTEIYARIFDSGTVLHAALEETVIACEADIRLFEDTINVAQALRHAPFAGRFLKGVVPLSQSDPLYAGLRQALALLPEQR